MYQKQYEAGWSCYNFKSLVVAIWNILKTGLKTRALLIVLVKVGMAGIGTFTFRRHLLMLF